MEDTGWEEVAVCPVCQRTTPLAGEEGIVRHLLAVHPEDALSRAIFARLVEVQLLDTTTAAEGRQS
jgi:hypothetical protein